MPFFCICIVYIIRLCIRGKLHCDTTETFCVSKKVKRACNGFVEICFGQISVYEKIAFIPCPHRELDKKKIPTNGVVRHSNRVLRIRGNTNQL